MSRYNSYGQFASNQNSTASLSVEPNTAFRGTLVSARATPAGQYGQSVAVVFENTVLVDGVLMENSEKPGKFKLYAWETILRPDVFEAGEFTADDAPSEYIETHPNGQNYMDLVAARVATEGVGEELSDETLIGDGSVTIYESGSGKPSATAKTLAQTISNYGKGALLSKSDVYNWIPQDLALRGDLAGRRVEYAKVYRTFQKEDGKDITCHQPMILDLETLQTVMVGQSLTGESVDAPGAAAGASETPATPVTDGGATTAPVAEPVAEPTSQPTQNAASSYPEPVADFVSWMVDFRVSDDAAIIDQLTTMVESPSNDLSEEMIEGVGGQDEIVQAVQTALSEQ